MCFTGAILSKSYVKWREADGIGEDCLSKCVCVCVETERDRERERGRRETNFIMWHHSFSITNAIFQTGSL